MVTTNQLERLRKDSAELSNYVHKLTKRGKEELAHKVQKKIVFIDDYIDELKLQSEQERY